MTESNASSDFTYMEDLKVGQKFVAGPLKVTAEDIIAFAKQFDPQPFHLDAEAAKQTPFGELVASGWHTASMTMRMIVDSSPNMEGGMIGRSVEKLNWLRAVKPGDTLSFEAEIIEMRGSGSDPSRGIMRIHNTTSNQNGEAVLTMESIVFVPRRPK